MRDRADAPGYGPADGDTEFEARLRELLGEQADDLRTRDVPYTTIVRRRRDEPQTPAVRRGGRARGTGRGARHGRRHVLPAGQWRPGGRAGLRHPAVRREERRPAAPLGAGAHQRVAGRTEGPVTPGQLADGITMERAADALEDCLAFEAKTQRADSPFRLDVGKSEDYRVILALNATGDMNSPGDGIRVVAIGTPAGTPVRLICTEKDGRTQGVNTSSGDGAEPGRGPVVPDINAFRLYKQDTATGPRLPAGSPSAGAASARSNPVSPRSRSPGAASRRRRRSTTGLRRDRDPEGPGGFLAPHQGL